MNEFNDKGRPNGVWKQYWGNGIEGVAVHPYRVNL